MFFHVSHAFSCHLEQDLNLLFGYGAFLLPAPQCDLLPHSPLLPPFCLVKRSPVTLTTLTGTFLWLESFPWPAAEPTPSLLPISAQRRPCQRGFLLVYSEMHKVTLLPSVSDSLSWLDHSSQSLPLSDTRLITCLLTVCRLKPKEGRDLLSSLLKASTWNSAWHIW